MELRVQEGFAERLLALEKIVGSRRALARWFGVTDPAIMAWQGGANPFESTLRKVLHNTGLESRWLLEGAGDEAEAYRRASAFARGDGADAWATPLGELQGAMAAAGLNAKSLARRIGYEIGVVQAVAEGRAPASEKMIEAICRVLPALSKEDLMSGSESATMIAEAASGSTYGSKPNVRLPPGTKARLVPVLSMAQAGRYQIEHTDEAYDYVGQLALDLDDRTAFAVEIEGDSMAPTINAGDWVICCPRWEPRAGDYAIVKTREGDVYCKLLQRLTPARVMLASLNPAHPPMTLEREELAWLYPVAQISKFVRRR